MIDWQLQCRYVQRVTRRWESKNFGPFLDALHRASDEGAQVRERLLGLLAQGSPQSRATLKDRLAISDAELDQALANVVAEGLVELFTSEATQWAKLRSDPAPARQGG
jgi:hypothetical protein